MQGWMRPGRRYVGVPDGTVGFGFAFLVDHHTQLTHLLVSLGYLTGGQRALLREKRSLGVVAG